MNPVLLRKASEAEFEAATDGWKSVKGCRWGRHSNPRSITSTYLYDGGGKLLGVRHEAPSGACEFHIPKAFQLINGGKHDHRSAA